uniref:Uncharacterized protein n=1 Tax=Arundo donax TaxID=35708 RepID=A0A0A9BH40_ARUDO
MRNIACVSFYLLSPLYIFNNVCTGCRSFITHALGTNR